MDQIIAQFGQQGIVVAGMALVIWYLVQDRKKSDERYNALIQKMMDTILPVVSNCTAVLSQVKEKLDEKDH